jgi:hypothetical protein
MARPGIKVSLKGELYWFSSFDSADRTNFRFGGVLTKPANWDENSKDGVIDVRIPAYAIVLPMLGIFRFGEKIAEFEDVKIVN